MTLLFLFLSLYIGINIRVSIILGILEALLLIAFIFYRFRWKVALFTFGMVLIGAGISFIRPSFNKSSYQALVIETKDNYYIASSSFERFYISEKNNHYEVGDIILLSGNKKELDFTLVESGFDFKEYLNNKGVYSEFIPSKVEYKFQTPFKIKQIKQEFLSNFDTETGSIVSLILFGNNIDSDTNELFRNLHLIRLISNSGIFLHLIYKIILKLMSYLIKDKYAKIISITLFACYGIFTFPRFVVIKFIFLQIILWINKYILKDKFKYLDIISISGIFFLLLDYHYGYQDSFLLAFLIPVFVLFFNGSFSKIKKHKKKLLLALFIGVLFIPFTLKYNNEISLLSLPFQLFLSPFTITYGIMCFLCFLRIPLYSGLSTYTLFFKNMLSTVEPAFIKINAPPFNSAAVIFYEITFVCIVYFLSIGFKDIYRKLIPICTFAFALYFVPIKRWCFPKVTFINVGQGDSCLISYKSTNVLIDTGGSKYKDYAKDCLIPYFKKSRIYSIDLLITTHDDIDHSGAADSLITNFKVKRYISTSEFFPVTISDISISNLNTYTSMWTEENDKSLVLYFTVQSCSFLIMGDAPKKIENEIVKNYSELHADILKVGHHGSNTSTSEQFLSIVSPTEAIISCGKNNSYGHPHNETISLLNKYDIKIRRTDIEGSIIYTGSFVY